MKNSGFVYDINHKNIDKGSARNLQICHTLFYGTTFFNTTFLDAYIYSFATDIFNYVMRVGIFYLALYGTFLLTYWLFSLITDKTDRIWLYRISILFRFGFILFIVFYGKSLANTLILAGVLNGLCDSMYYASFNVLKQEMVSRKNMKEFATLSAILKQLTSVVTPMLLGTLIQVSSFLQTSIYIAVIIAIMIVLSFFIKAKKPLNSDFSLKQYFKKLGQDEEVKKKMKFIYLIALTDGFMTVVGTLLNVCIMLQFGSSFSLGAITSIIGLCSIIQLFLFNKFTKPNKRNWLFYLMIIVPFIVSLIFVIWPSMTTIVIYYVGIASSKIMFNTLFDIYRNQNLKEAGLFSEIAEHQTVVESMFCIARTISFSILILVGLAKSSLVFEITFILFSCSYSVTALLVWIYEKKYIKPPEVILRSEKEQEKNFNKIIKDVYKK